MRKKDYNIVFSGLKLGSHSFEYEIDDSFLETLFDYDEAPGIQAHVDVEMVKQNTMLEFSFRLSGTLPVTCDITNEPFDIALDNSFELVVKFGDAFNNDDDEILILPHGEYEINIAQYIYELIALAMPTKRIHPDVLAGKANPEALELLEKYMPGEEEDNDDSDDDDDDVDPRWQKLKDLLN